MRAYFNIQPLTKVVFPSSAQLTLRNWMGMLQSVSSSKKILLSETKIYINNYFFFVKTYSIKGDSCGCGHQEAHARGAHGIAWPWWYWCGGDGGGGGLQRETKWCRVLTSCPLVVSSSTICFCLAAHNHSQYQVACYKHFHLAPTHMRHL